MLMSLEEEEGIIKTKTKRKTYNNKTRSSHINYACVWNDRVDRCERHTIRLEIELSNE